MNVLVFRCIHGLKKETSSSHLLNKIWLKVINKISKKFKFSLNFQFFVR